MSSRATNSALTANPNPEIKADPSTEKRQARVIAITSGKGGVGKTNISANLGISLAAQGHRVCIFDADTSLANINILLGLTPSHTLEHLLSGEKKIEEILLQGPGGLEIVPAASGIMEFVSLNKGQQKRLLTAVRKLSRRFDYLLIDTAAGINEPLLSFLQAAPYTIMTITPEPTSLTDAFSLLKVLKGRDFNHPVFVVVNMAPGLTSAHDAYKRFRDAVAKYLNIKVYYLGHVLSDGELSHAVLKQQPVILQRPYALASRCIRSLSERLERTLSNHDQDEADFCTLLDELIPAQSDEQTKPTLAITAQAKKKDYQEDLRQHLLNNQLSADALEGLLFMITNSWLERFGAPPASLVTAYAQGGTASEITSPQTTETDKTVAQTLEAQDQDRIGRELAGLHQALHYAQLLARSERKNQGQ